MRILHYFLGFPPYRTGGLIKFAYDLMLSQKEKNDEVFALWPGKILLTSNVIKIKERKDIEGIRNYEIINPLPVPFDEGILDTERFMVSCDVDVYVDFLESINPDAIHIHTLMGLHKEFVEAANKLKIKTIFTTHDYFGICPKVTLFKKGNACEYDNGCADCVNCNKTALSYKKLIMLQSPFYRNIKNFPIVKKIRQKHRRAFFDEVYRSQDMSISENERIKYERLRNFYITILEMIDLIHFNSSVAESVYKKYVFPKKSVVLSISNRDIKNNTNLKKIKSDKIRFTFLSPAKQFKGYDIIKNTFDKIWQEGRKDFVLNLYTSVPQIEPYMNIQECGFKRDELENIFANTDYLLAPSIWYETFGFTVLEALSYGVPVIISDRVGAKDIVGNSGIITTNFEESIRKVLDNLELKIKYHKEIIRNVSIKTLNEQYIQFKELYNE